MTNANVTLSPYERAVNTLNELTPRQDTIISAALDRLRTALATAQAERSEALEKADKLLDVLEGSNKNHARLIAERDAAIKRAEAAEARFVEWSGTDVPALNIALTAARQDAYAQRQRAEQAEAALARLQQMQEGQRV